MPALGSIPFPIGNSAALGGLLYSAIRTNSYTTTLLLFYTLLHLLFNTTLYTNYYIVDIWIYGYMAGGSLIHD